MHRSQYYQLKTTNLDGIVVNTNAGMSNRSTEINRYSPVIYTYTLDCLRLLQS